MKQILTISLILGLWTACSDPNPKDVHSTPADTAETGHHAVNSEKKKDCNDVHWSHHEGHEGPKNWKNLCDGFSPCGETVQSPINIITNKTTKSADLTALKVNYGSTKVDINNNGHTEQFNISRGNTMMIGDKEYKLLQFHYHAESEHTIDGNHFPVEVHFVHKYSDTDFAVVGIMIQEGEDNALLAEHLSHFPIIKDHYISNATIVLNELLPSDLSYYHYKGSLTTPPCSEVVSWYVLKAPIEASKEQIDKLSKILRHNFRPVMPLNDRDILSFEETPHS